MATSKHTKEEIIPYRFSLDSYQTFAYLVLSTLLHFTFFFLFT